MAPKKLAAGNWKMNGLTAALAELDAIAARDNGCDVLICPPATLITAAVAHSGEVAIGGQDCHAKDAGAHTGDISAAMLRDAGASHVILGHSERRTDHAETDPQVAAKAGAAYGAGLVAVICIGETEAERDGGQTLDVIATQLAGSVPDAATAANTVIAYEPVWAIGTGRTPTNDQIAEVHALMREKLAARFADGADFTLLYGGSVKPGNASEIFDIPHVNGALVGGASLKAADFGPIIDALAAA
ncbi:MAG TPA: triose-phosphate isomerase [Paracoccus sp. (in: a-proteobacteria)]|uniref:triose-phosphate isomerase n=1 Tax=uncultured Paracoccus sp. TaxID=189685 RepID=UPI002605B634|nr:triose-phosphate isomerase [uncultured Paracoccus sp.]HMQ40919.1 triose-phosphate isomerase [Paracoccus sp. (in: a-proteobacteria)]HMR36187.1 triose-phosphate isomerase [Paracoccus sp. (in: a-proteobacteria)]